MLMSLIGAEKIKCSKLDINEHGLSLLPAPTYRYVRGLSEY